MIDFAKNFALFHVINKYLNTKEINVESIKKILDSKSLESMRSVPQTSKNGFKSNSMAKNRQSNKKLF